VFQPKTLFVMGAGASTEFNFPTGAALMNIIKEKLVYDEAKFSLSDAAIHRALLTHVNGTPPGAPVIYGLSDYVDAARQIVRAGESFLDSIPLARRIAAATVEAFEQR
jgi:hypothetical protein